MRIGYLVKRSILLVLGILLMSFFVKSQNYTLSGSVKDAASGDPLPYASITLLNINSDQIKGGAVSDRNGNFKLKASDKSNSIIVSFIGYSSDTILFDSGNMKDHSIDLGQIKLLPVSLKMNEITIESTVRTSVEKIDRIIYHSKDFETAKGGSATDLLNKLPSVAVSPDGEISVRGTTDFMVYVNGKPTQTDVSIVLSQLSADQIVDIEIITIPSAKYDSQGKGGIINITTKSNTSEGLLAVASLTGGGAPWGDIVDEISSYHLNDYRTSGNLSLSYGKGKLGVFANGSLGKRNVNGNRFGDARILSPVDGSYRHMTAQGNRPEWYSFYTTELGFDYRINPKSMLRLGLLHGAQIEGRSAFYVYNVFNADEFKQPISGVATDDQWIYNPNTDNRYGKFNTFEINYSTRLGESSSITASGQYEVSRLNRGLDNENYFYYRDIEEVGPLDLHYTQIDSTPLTSLRLSIEYDKKLGNGNSISIGIQPQILNISGSFSYDTLGVNLNQWGDYLDLENRIDLNRDIYAGYINYNGTYRKLSFNAGVRVEYTDQKLNIDNPDYFTIFQRQSKSGFFLTKLDLFPTLHAMYDIDETTKLKFAASRRINRPPVKNMAPFLYRRHFEVYVVGDPDLKPEYINVLELTAIKNIGKLGLSLTGFYRNTENAIFRVNTVYYQEGVLIRSYTNSGSTTAIGAELSSNIDIGSKAKFFVSGSLYNYKVNGEIFGYNEDNTSLNWNVKSNMNIRLYKGLSFTSDFNIKSATVTAQGQNDLFYSLNSALGFQPENRKAWNFSVKVLDILGSNIQGLDTRAFNSDAEQVFFQETTYYRNGPIAELTVVYKLNAVEIKKKNNSSVGKEEF